MEDALAHFFYWLRNWFRMSPGPGKKKTFVSGSEEELERVTRWMCHANPRLFTRTMIRIGYGASEGKEQGRIRVIDYPQILSSPEENYLAKCGAVILKHNCFMGTEWFRDLATRSPLHKSLFGLFEWPIELTFCVPRPSASEHAEALLCLSEWLNGKVSEQEKRELLQLSEEAKG